MDEQEENERELLAALYTTMLCTGVTVVLSEGQIEANFNKMEGDGAMREYLDNCNVQRLGDFMSNFPNKFQRVGPGKWKPVNDGTQQDILNVMAGPKKSKGGRGGSASSRSRGSFRGRPMGNTPRNGNASGFKSMPAFNRGGYQNRNPGSYGSAFRKQPPPQDNVSNQRPLHRPPDHRVASKNFVPNYASSHDVDRNRGYDRQPSPPRRRNDYQDDSRDFDDRRNAPPRWNDDRDSGYNRPVDNQRRRTPSPPRGQRPDYGGPSNYGNQNYRNNDHHQDNYRNNDHHQDNYRNNDHYQDNYRSNDHHQDNYRNSDNYQDNRNRDIDARDYNASRGFFKESAYDDYDRRRRSPSPQRRQYSPSPSARGQWGSNWNESPPRNEGPRERTPPNHRRGSPSQRYDARPRDFNDRRGASPPRGSFRGPSSAQSQRNFNDRRDGSPSRETYRNPSPVRSQRSFNDRNDRSPPRGPSRSEDQSHRSYTSQQVDRSPERAQSGTDDVKYKKPERVEIPDKYKKPERVENAMDEIAKSFGSAHIGKQSGITENVTLDINVAEALVEVLQNARKTSSGGLDMTAIFSTFERKNNTTFPGSNYRGKMKNLHDLKARFPDILRPLNLTEEGKEKWDPSAPASNFPSAPPGIPTPPGLARFDVAPPPGIAPPGFSATRSASPTPSSNSGRNDYASPSRASPQLPNSLRSFNQLYSPYTNDSPLNPDSELCRKIRQKVVSFKPDQFDIGTVCEKLKESLGNMYSFDDVRHNLTYVLFQFYRNKYSYALGGNLEHVRLNNRTDSRNVPNFFRASQVNPLLMSNVPEKVTVVTTYFTNFQKFGVQLKSEVDEFEMMDKEISKVFADSTRNFIASLSDFKPGHACIAQKDIGSRGIDKFHRGIVLSSDDTLEAVLVHFIDVGKTASVMQDYLFVMPPQFENIPPFGISCCCEMSTDEQKSVKKRWGSRFQSESLSDFEIAFVPGKVLPPKSTPEVWTIPVEVYASQPNGVMVNVRDNV